MRRILSLLAGLLIVTAHARLHAEPTIPVWPDKAPGETKALPPEANMTTEKDGKPANRPVIRIGNVSTPTLEIFRPKKDIDTGAAVIICPGGGHRILAYDLEGTEVAGWLASKGVSAFVLKYRVPARDPNKRYEAAVQDAQRAISLVRSKAGEYRIDPKKIGIVGFSAGGETAGLTGLLPRQYSPIDAVDQIAYRPDFAVLVYAGGFHDEKTGTLRDYVKVTETAPPMFLVHAGDDRVNAENSIQLYSALKKAKVPAELHVYASGGHGYGLRPTDAPVTQWPSRCEDWLKGLKILK
jgi:acetyl esterase/lipase